MKSIRADVANYIKGKYSISPERLWTKFPEYEVFRHGDNRKWFAIIMDVEPDKLGLAGNERVDIIDVKVDDSMLKDILLQQDGYYPGYHMSKKSWISIILDGSVSLEEVCNQIDGSFEVTKDKRKR